MFHNQGDGSVAIIGEQQYAVQCSNEGILKYLFLIKLRYYTTLFNFNSQKNFSKWMHYLRGTIRIIFHLLHVNSSILV